MSNNSNPPQQVIMTSPVFRYAVLVVLSVVVIMGAAVCYRTRVYQRRMRHLNADLPRPIISPAARDWGPPPELFDVCLDPPKERPESDWDEIMPISATRGGLDSSGASSMARICVMINMPSPRPFAPQHTVPDDERYLPYAEIGLSDVDVLLDVKGLRTSSESDGAASKKKGS
ncbi:hypothetical protein C8R43DRAFT_941082 [Mycena crocata]|nr:hypothetical protein C8R43DRAFT_941082 [Mycena crocata]